MLRFDGRTVIVTGSSKGIGLGFATMFAERGARVVISGRSSGPLEQAAEDLAAKGGEVTAYCGDVSTEVGGKELVEHAIRRFGRLDIVVNNAGILNFAPFGTMSAARFNDLVGVNLGSAFNVTRAAWPHLISQGGGRVLMLASQAVFGGVSTSHYSASKGAVLSLMRSLSLEGRPHGINVNGIIPLAFTEMHAATVQSGSRGKFSQALDDLCARDAQLGIPYDPHDKYAAAKARLSPALVASAAGWLCHDTCEITGEMIIAGGGHFARMILAETPGYYAPDPSPEAVRDNWAEVCREEGFLQPSDSTGCSVMSIRRILSGAAGG